jgi:predicted CxxxxCH...CXXCH cytochrome family protein
LALPTALTCATCHTGYESGSLGHYNAANARTAAPMAPSPVAFASPNPFQAESGASSVTSNASAFTCSNISCHGGQTTPGWQSGTLVTLSACTSCHARGTSQYNSYNSGEHEKHVVEEGVACTSCHTMANATGHPRATNHFDNLSTPVMDGPASDTIVPVGGVYTPGGTPGNGGCTTTCHEPESW